MDLNKDYFSKKSFHRRRRDDKRTCVCGRRSSCCQETDEADWHCAAQPPRQNNAEPSHSYLVNVDRGIFSMSSTERKREARSGGVGGSGCAGAWRVYWSIH